MVENVVSGHNLFFAEENHLTSGVGNNKVIDQQIGQILHQQGLYWTTLGLITSFDLLNLKQMFFGKD